MKIILSKGRELVLYPAQTALLVMVFLTLANGFVNSLSYGFGGFNESDYCTFLSFPPDVYGDLLKPSFVSPPFLVPDTHGWPPLILNYYRDNPYILQNLQSNPHITGFSFLHVTPITLMCHILVKILILGFSPQFVIAFFYIAALLGLWMAARALTATLISGALIFLALAISYPFLMILSRGNMGALVNGIALLLYLHAMVQRRNFGQAVMFLAVAAVFRPNVLFLCPLLLNLGLRPAIIGSMAAGFILALCYGIFFHLDALLYPGYGLGAHWEALKVYTSTYIVGTYGDQFNNSAFGAIKFIICAFHGRDCADLGGTLRLINLFSTLVFTSAFLVFGYLFWRQRISPLAFAFAGLSCFVLATTILGSYHLLPFAAFPLLMLGKASLRSSEGVILLTSVFVMSPKQYVFMQGISFETFLNPLFLTASLIFLAMQSLQIRQPASGDN